MVHDKRLCSAQAVTTCFAAFHVVIGQDFHVVPPGFAVEVRSLLSNAGQGQHEDCCEAREYFAHHGFPSFLLTIQRVVIPNPELAEGEESAFFSGRETADSSRHKPALGMTNPDGYFPNTSLAMV